MRYLENIYKTEWGMGNSSLSLVECWLRKVRVTYIIRSKTLWVGFSSLYLIFENKALNELGREAILFEILLYKTEFIVK